MSGWAFRFSRRGCGRPGIRDRWSGSSETLREDLLQVLPGYKGPDVYSRGVDPESEAFFFLDELEAIIREWVAVVYHRRPHSGLPTRICRDADVAGEDVRTRGGARRLHRSAPRPRPGLRIPQDRVAHDPALRCGDRWPPLQRPVLDRYRNTSSAYGGKGKGRWPFQVDPDDVTRIYFRDPDTRRYHALVWEHAPSLMMPFSEDALAFARELAAAKYTYPDDTIAVADLFERWKLGLGATAKERRMALRMSRDQAVPLNDLPGPQEPEVAQLPSVARVMAAAGADEVKSEGSDSEEQTLRDRRRRFRGTRGTFTPMRWRMCGRGSRSAPTRPSDAGQSDIGAQRGLGGVRQRRAPTTAGIIDPQRNPRARRRRSQRLQPPPPGMAREFRPAEDPAVGRAARGFVGHPGQQSARR